MGTKICMNNLDLMDYVTLVLKPISKKILEQIGDNTQVYYLADFDFSETVAEDRKRKDGGSYELVKTYGSARLATEFSKDQGKISWDLRDRRKVMIMGTANVSEGLYVSLDDLMKAKKPAPVTVGLSASVSDSNDE